MPNFQIRVATPEDQSELETLIYEGNIFHQQLLPEYLEPLTDENPGREAPVIAALTEDRALLIAVTSSGNSLGFILMSLMGKEPKDWIPRKVAHVDMVVVKPSFRGQKLGTKLMEAGENWAKDKGSQAIRLGVMARNKGAYNLYKTLGYNDFVIEMDKWL